MTVPQTREIGNPRRSAVSPGRLARGVRALHPPGMLHVANGDHALSVLRAAGLQGEVIAWSDVLDQGPVRGEPGTAAFRKLRAEWLATNGAGELEQVSAQLERWDAALRTPAGETVLWFEADLTCQLALLHHLVLIEASAVVTREPVPEQKDFAALLDTRKRYDRAQARRAWEAVAAPDPRGLQALDVAGLPPQMGPALRRLIEELPEVGSGLSRTERTVLEEEGSFPRVQAGDVESAILPAILELQAELAGAAPGEHHPVLGRRQAPFRRDARRHVRAVAVGRVRLPVAGGAGEAHSSAAGRTALDRLLMDV